MKKNHPKNSYYFVKRETKKLNKKCNNCGKNDPSPLHTCPYAEEINNDYTTTCNCCSYCCSQCAWDI